MRSTFRSELQLKTHLKEYHNQIPISDYLREIVLGGIDGIITTLAVVSGFEGAQKGDVSLSVIAVLLFGFANLIADGLSMGLGNFLSIHSEKQAYKKQLEKEIKEITENKLHGIKQTKFLLKKDGFSDEETEKLVNLFSKNEKFWLEYLMRKELGMTGESEQKPAIRGFATFLSFVTFGFIPLIPYILSFSERISYQISILCALIALLLLGLVRWKVTGEKVTKAIFETLLVGSVASIAAFVVGLQFR